MIFNFFRCNNSISSAISNRAFLYKKIDDQNKFNADDTIQKSAEGMLRELLVWTGQIKEMRDKKE
ncbi:MAG: hypothetical protein WKF85_14820 [Chitinophagaceae bacterium]